MDTFEEKLHRQRELEQEKKKERQYGYDDEWGGEKSPRIKVKYHRKDKYVGRFIYCKAEEGD